MGPEVYELEDILAKDVGVKYCISCSSGTDALLILLMAKGVGPGDAILTSIYLYSNRRGYFNAQSNTGVC